MGLNVSHTVKNNTMENLNYILCGECIDKYPKKLLIIHSVLKIKLIIKLIGDKK